MGLSPLSSFLRKHQFDWGLCLSPLATGLPGPVTEVACPSYMLSLGTGVRHNSEWGVREDLLNYFWEQISSYKSNREEDIYLLPLDTVMRGCHMHWYSPSFYCEGSQLESGAEMPGRLESKDRRDAGSRWHRRAPAGSSPFTVMPKAARYTR